MSSSGRLADGELSLGGSLKPVDCALLADSLKQRRHFWTAVAAGKGESKRHEQGSARRASIQPGDAGRKKAASAARFLTLWMLEVAGIEPASEGTPSPALHA